MSCVLMLQRGHSGDGCVLASTLCKYYTLRKGDLFFLNYRRQTIQSWCANDDSLKMLTGKVHMVHTGQGKVMEKSNFSW